jgi:hypothetical protein
MTERNDKYQTLRQEWFTTQYDSFVEVVSITSLSLKEKAMLLNSRGITTMTGRQFTRTNLHSFAKQITNR